METAPKDILGDFPRMSRENAEAAMGRFPGQDGENDDFRMKQNQEGNNDSPRRDFPDRRNNENFPDQNQRFGDGFMDQRRRGSPDNRFNQQRFDRNSPNDFGRGSRGRNDDDDRRRGDFDDRRRNRNNRNNDGGDNRNFGRFRNDHDHRNNNNNNNRHGNNDSRGFDNNGQNFESNFNNSDGNQFSGGGNNFVPNSQFFGGHSDQNDRGDMRGEDNRHGDQDFRKKPPQMETVAESSRFQGNFVFCFYQILIFLCSLSISLPRAGKS